MDAERAVAAVQAGPVKLANEDRASARTPIVQLAQASSRIA